MKTWQLKKQTALLFLAVLAALAALAVFAGCGDGGGDADSGEGALPDDQLAARVGDWEMSKEELMVYVEQMTESQRRKYDTPGGHAELTDRVIDDELFYREALKTELSEVNWVKRQLDDAAKRVLVSAYYREYIDKAARPSEEEIHDYYETHSGAYTSLEIMRAQHIFSKSKEKLDDLKVRIVEGGEKMTTMAHRYSEDKLTASDGGDLGYFNRGGYIRGVGYSDTFSEAVFAMEPRVLYGPIKWDKGYSLVRVNEKRPADLKPYDEVRQEISDFLTRQHIERVRGEKIKELRKRYEFRNFMDEFYRQRQRSPEELFEYAQNSDDSYARIRAFEEIVEKFPDSEHAPKALFMIGFVHNEELRDRVAADKHFSSVIQNYPDSEIAESARWMLNNLDKGTPEFETLDELNEKLSEESQ